MQYRIKSEQARNRGALGIFYPIAETIEAESVDAAILAFREKYETNAPPVRADVYDELKAAGVPLDHHESDLYAKDCPEARMVLRRFPELKPATFISQIDGAFWIDLPFMFSPFWESKAAAAATK